MLFGSSGSVARRDPSYNDLRGTASRRSRKRCCGLAQVTTDFGGHLAMNTDVRPEPSSSGRKVAMGAMASGAVNVIKVILQLLLLPIMARLLGPSEFGLYALALPTVS